MIYINVNKMVVPDNEGSKKSEKDREKRERER
jgi:hypothetical protein